jgi:hypothetical protein
MGNTPLVYSSSEVQSWEFTLYLNASLLQRRGRVDKATANEAMKDYNSFLQSLTVPVQQDFKGWAGGEPPMVFFSWPELLSCRCRVESVKWSLKQFYYWGGVCHQSAKIKLLVDLKYLYWSDEIRALGWEAT